MRNALALPIAAVALVSAACARQLPYEPAAITTLTGATTLEAGERGCAFLLPRVHVTAEDTPEGIALSFRTVGADVVELRRRTREAAARYHRREPGLYVEELGLRPDAPSARAGADDIDDGSRIHFVPNRPAELGALRAEHRARAAAMNSAVCPWAG